MLSTRLFLSSCLFAHPDPRVFGNTEAKKQCLSPSPSMSPDPEIVTKEPLRLVVGEGPPVLAVRSPSGTILPDPIPSTEEGFDLSSVPHSPTSPLPMDEDETPQAPTPKTRDMIGGRHTAPGELGDPRDKMSMGTIAPQFSLDAAMDKLVGSLHAIYNEDRSPNLPSDLMDAVTARDDGYETEMTINGFQLDWMCTEPLPYSRTRHIRNPWDHSREVRVSKDGYELEPGCGQQLIDEWQRYVVEQRAGDRGLPRRRQTESSPSSA